MKYSLTNINIVFLRARCLRNTIPTYVMVQPKIFFHGSVANLETMDRPNRHPHIKTVKRAHVRANLISHTSLHCATEYSTSPRSPSGTYWWRPCSRTQSGGARAAPTRTPWTVDTWAPNGPQPSAGTASRTPTQSGDSSAECWCCTWCSDSGTSVRRCAPCRSGCRAPVAALDCCKSKIAIININGLTFRLITNHTRNAQNP